jgi:hypothetical protein
MTSSASIGWSLAAVGMLLVLSVSGCAALFVDGPADDRNRAVQPTCTTDKGWVYVDDIIGIANAVSFWVYDDIERDTGQDMAGPKISAVVSMVVHGVSSLVGGQRVKACRKAHAEYEAYVVDDVPRAPAFVHRRVYWCVSSDDDPGIGACNKTEASCESSRLGLMEEESGIGLCQRKTVVACFTTLVGGQRKRGCAPTLEACDRARESRIRDARDVIEISQCSGADERMPTVRIEPVQAPDEPAETVTTPAAQHCIAVDGNEQCFATAAECTEHRAASLPMFSIGECIAR